MKFNANRFVQQLKEKVKIELYQEAKKKAEDS